MPQIISQIPAQMPVLVTSSGDLYEGTYGHDEDGLAGMREEAMATLASAGITSAGITGVTRYLSVRHNPRHNPTVRRRRPSFHVLTREGPSREGFEHEVIARSIDGAASGMSVTGSELEGQIRRHLEGMPVGQVDLIVTQAGYVPLLLRLLPQIGYTPRVFSAAAGTAASTGSSGSAGSAGLIEN